MNLKQTEKKTEPMYPNHYKAQNANLLHAQNAKALEIRYDPC